MDAVGFKTLANVLGITFMCFLLHPIYRGVGSWGEV